MARDLFVKQESFALATAFVISRGAKVSAEVVTCTISDGEHAGRGECVPYARYGETVESVIAAIEKLRGEIADGATRDDLLTLMPAGAARNAVDCALWDLEAKRDGRPVHVLLGEAAPKPLVTAITVGLGEPEEMEAKARSYARHPLIKVKVGTSDDVSRIEAVARGAPQSRIILDANEGWSEGDMERHLAAAARCGVALIEQPLPQGKDALLRDIARPVPICADESVHTSQGLEDLVGLYDAVNIKLDKTGGLTEALKLRERARALGFQVMVGCMVGTSLAMAPAVLAAQGAEFVDLDGPLLLSRDREPGLTYDGTTVSPPEPQLWG